MTSIDSPASHAAAVPDWLALVREKVEGLGFGVLQIVVHDHKATQIEHTERVRLDAAPTQGSRRERT